MFEAKYSRLKFWIISIVLLIPTTILNIFAQYFESREQNDNAMVLYIIVFIISLLWLNALANRIRDYGSNPWIALFSIVPLVNIGLALFYGIAKSNIKETVQKSDNNSLTSAVYNHSKDIINGIKPAINEYKENHISSNSNSQNSNININESKIYEDIMLEIEQDNKIKSIWAKALSLSEGNKDKAESLYINMRFDELKYEPSYKKEESNFENQQEINSNILNKENIEIKRDTSSKKIVFLIVLISILLLACFIIFPLIYFNLNKDASITTNETLPKESTYSPKVENSNKDASITTNETLSKESTYSSKVENSNSVSQNIKSDKSIFLIQNKNKKYGFVDINGNWIIQPIFDNAYNFSNDLARVVINKKYGYIDKKGNLVIQPIFESAWNFSDDLAMAVLNGEFIFLDKKGNIVIHVMNISPTNFSEGLSSVMLNDSSSRMGYIDKKGNWIIQPILEYANDFKEGIAGVKYGGKWGYIDKKGNWVIQPAFESVNDFKEELAAVEYRGKWGYIDKKGNWVIQPIFEFGYKFSEGLAKVKNKDKYGYIDKKGIVVIQPIFERANDFKEELAAVEYRGKWGYIDKKGNWVIQPIFDAVGDFNDGFAVVRVNDKYVYIDKKGTIIIQAMN